MTKKLITIFTLIFLTSCQNWANKELEKTAKASSASDRINSTDSNSKDVFKELDE
jgi:hypothetical protein